jgi:hypothetical protein
MGDSAARMRLLDAAVRSWIAVTCWSRQFYRPMIIAMAIVWVMQPAVYEVIHVITVGHAFVSAARPMRMRAPGVGRATRGVGVADLDNMFVDVIPMHVMQMTIVEVIDMAMMAHSRVSTARTMLVSVIGMMLLVAEGHGFARQSKGLVRQVVEA